jgi:hypothetical protein
MYLVKEPGLPADSLVLKRVRNQNRWFLEIQRTVQHCIKKPQEKAFFVFLGKKNLFINFFYKIAFHFSFSFRSLPPVVHPFVDERSLGRALHASRRTHARPPTRRLSDLRFVFALLLRLLRFSLQFVPTIWHKENQVVTMQELLL